MNNTEQTIYNLIIKQNVSFLSSVDEDGFPNTKAMLPPRKLEGINQIYFSTNTSSIRVTQFNNNSKSCLYFVDRRYFRGVMLVGNTEVIHDMVIKKDIWQDGDELYYPLGIEDPDFCVLKFTTKRVRYYSNYNSKDFSIKFG